MRISDKTGSRRSKGHAVIELSCSAFLLLVFTILTSDVCIVIFGAYQNDQACRDAARAAAQGQDQIQSTKLAIAALKAHAGDGYYFSNPAIQGIVTYIAYGGSPPPNRSPFVQLTTSTVARMPFAPLQFANGPIFVKNGTVTFTQSYAFPIVRTK